MKDYLNIFWKALGYALVIFLIVNVTDFIVEFYNNNEPDWYFIFDKGQFSLNGKSLGCEIFSAKANVLMLLVFLYVFIDEIIRKRKQINN